MRVIIEFLLPELATWRIRIDAGIPEVFLLTANNHFLIRVPQGTPFKIRAQKLDAAGAVVGTWSRELLAADLPPGDKQDEVFRIQGWTTSWN